MFFTEVRFCPEGFINKELFTKSLDNLNCQIKTRCLIINKSIIRWLVLCLTSTIISAQSDLFPLEDYIGGGIGYSPMFLQLDSIPGSARLAELGFNPGTFKTPFILQGGEGFTQIAGHWRIGGYSGVGATRISTVPDVKLYINRDGVPGYQPPPAIPPADITTIDSAVVYTGDYSPSVEAKFSFALGAVTIEYVIPVFRDIEISTGAMMGVGHMNLSIDQHSGTPRWDNIFQNVYGEIIDSTLYYLVENSGALGTAQSGGLVSGPLASQYTSVGGIFFNFQPYIAVKWQILDRVGLRLSVGFHKGTLASGRWFLNDRAPISDSPESALQGIAIRTMLYFGL